MRGVPRVLPRGNLAGPAPGRCFKISRSLRLNLATDATDDLTPTDQVTYALFTGTSKAGAESEPTPFAFRPREEGMMSVAVLAPDAQWFSVAPIDLAGNVGPRSEAIKVDVLVVDSGCSASPSRQTGWRFAYAVIAAAALVARRRREVALH